MGGKGVMQLVCPASLFKSEWGADGNQRQLDITPYVLEPKLK